MWRRRKTFAAVMLAVLLAVSMAVTASPFPSGAQDSIEDARDERQKVREEKAAAAKELNAARAEDAELATALRDITDIVNAQRAEVDEATRQLETNQGLAAAAQEAIEEAETAQATLEADLAGIAVAGFLNSGQEASAFLNSSDLNEAMRQASLLEEANVDTVDLLEELRVVREDRDIAESEAADAVAEAERIESELALKLSGYEEQQAVQAELKAEMERRVAAYEAEVRAFESEESELAAFIRAEEARLNPPTPTSAPAPGSASVSGFQWPIPGRVGSGYGYRVHPIFGTKRLHKGVDIGAATGVPIGAAKGGTILSAGWRNGYGNTVVISHGDGVTSLYAHQSKVAVSAGQQVNRGDLIGYVGSTGWSTGPHLHFEIRINGSPVNPANYLP